VSAPDPDENVLATKLPSGDPVVKDGEEDRELSGRGVVLRCSACMREQRIDTGDAYPSRQPADAFLHLMTGGHFGSAPFAFRRTEPSDGSIIGLSVCCGAQLAGELYGYGDP